MSKKGKTFSFLGGALVGLGLGFLFAPKSGSETRKELANQISNLWDKVRKLDANEIKENISNKLNEIEAELRSLDKEKVRLFLTALFCTVCWGLCYPLIKLNQNYFSVESTDIFSQFFLLNNYSYS